MLDFLQLMMIDREIASKEKTQFHNISIHIFHNALGRGT